jgi:hypothetical protein
MDVMSKYSQSLNTILNRKVGLMVYFLLFFSLSSQAGSGEIKGFQLKNCNESLCVGLRVIEPVDQSYFSGLYSFTDSILTLRYKGSEEVVTYRAREGFYNANQNTIGLRKVEDYSGELLVDLEKSVIRKFP